MTTARARAPDPAYGVVRLMLAGDVMTGRGIDQILPHPVDPTLHEAYVRDARRYVALAEAANGPVERPVSPAYPWGDALAAIELRTPALRIVNLETAVTTSEAHWPGKGIHYRMHPANVECLRAARLDGCLLANNHVLDWGRAGLQETLSVLAAAGLATTGAGADEAAAAKPAAFGLGGGRRLLVFAWAFPSSGVPGDWAATPARPGVAWLPDLSRRSLRRAIDVIASRRQGGDLVVASLHWGGNWGYDVGRAARGFAHGLIDDGGVAVVHGHSSHHPKAAEVHRGRLILYGAGDLINDYEGISGHEAFRDDLVALYFVDVESDTGRLAGLELVPFQLRRLQLRRAAPDDARWLHARLESEYRRFGLRLMAGEDEAAAFRLAALPRS